MRVIFFLKLLVSYLLPLFVGSYTPDTNQFNTAPHVRYISSGCYVKMCQKFSKAKGLFCLIFNNALKAAITLYIMGYRKDFTRLWHFT